jgi:hypothetical protein
VYDSLIYSARQCCQGQHWRHDIAQSGGLDALDRDGAKDGEFSFWQPANALA